MTQLDNQAVWLLLNGQLAHESTETDVDWKTVVAGIPTVMSGSVALQRFAATILERQRRINSQYRDDDEKLVLTVARQMRLPLQIETVFVMGSSSRGTFVAAPHLDHEAPDLDVGIQLEPCEVNPDELLEALLSDTRSLLIPALNRGYIAVDEGQSADSVEHSTPSDDNVHNVLANVDLWESERGRFGIKATWFMSRRLSRSIDLIPFRRVGEGSLPQLLLWDGHTRNWVPNNPPLFSHNFQVCSEQNPILPIVTSLVKYWNQIQSVDDAGKAPLKGMHIESLLLEARLPSDLASAFALGLKYCATVQRMFWTPTWGHQVEVYMLDRHTLKRADGNMFKGCWKVQQVWQNIPWSAIGGKSGNSQLVLGVCCCVSLAGKTMVMR